MSRTKRIYVGSVGVRIDVRLQEDLSQAANMAYHVRRPDGLDVVWMPIVLASDNQGLSYTTKPGDIGLAGTYKMQVYLQLGDWAGLTETVQFQVHERFT